MKMYEDVAFKLSPAKFDLSFFRSQVNMHYINYKYIYVCILQATEDNNRDDGNDNGCDNGSDDDWTDG